MYLNNPLKKYIFPLITIIVASLALFALTIVSVCNEKTPNKILEEYPRLKDTKSVYEVVDAEKALRILQSGENCCMLFAFPSCPWCQQLLPILNSTAKKCKVNKIYYVDIKNMRDNTESRDHETYLKIAELVL